NAGNRMGIDVTLVIVLDKNRHLLGILAEEGVRGQEAGIRGQNLSTKGHEKARKNWLCLFFFVSFRVFSWMISDSSDSWLLTAGFALRPKGFHDRFMGGQTGA